MTTVPASPAIGDKISADWGSEVHDALELLLDPPEFLGYQASAQTLSTGWTAITLDTEVTDTKNGHSTSSNTSRYTAQVAGTYKVTAQIAFAQAAGGATNNVRAARLQVNGAELTPKIQVQYRPPASGSTIFQIGGDLDLDADDYIELAGNPNETGLDMVAGYSWLSVRWAHP